ncbi:rod-binding protein [Sphingobium subterraneum]|uniref:Flagellar protein FlgJ n=1 Tax=Sphingobium subterraneum TaxID=627688 RepID=A0A841J2R3_9SPHN|nr:rod-binding protein [Sphingobium subterraneum]MBB6123816.1 flagellar protein FlgJ [Sphingobium subterraneum]
MTQVSSPLSPSATVAATAAPDPSLVKAAKAFEAIFLRQMISAMRSSSLSEGLNDSSAGEQFRDMSDARTADNMAETGSFGVANMLIRQLSRPPATPGTAAAGYAAANPAPATESTTP